MSEPGSEANESTQVPKENGWRIVWGCLPWALFGVALVAIPVAFLIGGISGNNQVYFNLRDREETRIRELMSQYPEFSKLRIESAPKPYPVWLEGELTQEELHKLNMHLEQMFGDQMASEMSATIDVSR